ncbi:MAG: phenylacetate-CoA ligase, partial [Mycobacterium sp.]|nr:phenylacetate-CoA ligase [Mycobacterium sp.]
RYRTRDLTKLLPGTARSMRRMQKVTGRCDDMIILRGVNLFPTQIEELILGIEELSPQFECVLDRPGRMDQLTVRVESRHDIGTARRLAAGDILKQHVKNRIGVSVLVDVLEPESIERSVGKARRLIDRRSKG